MAGSDKLNVAVIGCGLAARAQHLLALLPDKVESFPPAKLGARDAVEIARNVSDKVLRKVRLRRGPAGGGLVDSGHYRQIRDFVTGVREGSEFCVSHAQARKVVALWEQIVGSYSSPTAPLGHRSDGSFRTDR
jgi:predicted dehydrogenase